MLNVNGLGYIGLPKTLMFAKSGIQSKSISYRSLYYLKKEKINRIIINYFNKRMYTQLKLLLC